MDYEGLKVRYNIMEVATIDTFANIKGGYSGDCKDVYFIRMLGINNTFLQDIKKMDKDLSERMASGSCIYNRINGLPRLTDFDRSNYYAACYERWLAGGRKEADIRLTQNDGGLKNTLGAACDTVLKLFSGSNPNASLEKNFAVKLLYWFDELAAGFVNENAKAASKKFVISNITKKQEYLFCYLLTLTGIDVMVLSYNADIDKEAEEYQISKKVILGTFCDCEVPDYDHSIYMRMADSRAGAGKNAVGNPAGSAAKASDSAKDNGAAAETPLRIAVRRPERDRRTKEYLESINGDISGETSGGRNPGGVSGSTSGAGNAGSIRRPPVSAGPSDIWQRPSGSAIQTPSSPGIQTPSRGSSGGVSLARPGMSAARQGSGERRELEFEELALLASSVVMIAIHGNNGDVIGTGSGIMIGRKGYILTNNHVASGGKYYSVRIEDDEKVYKTDEIIKYNHLLDLAVIRIDRELKPLPVYSGTRQLVRGQKVVAIGSPLGLFNSVSDGIISGFRKFNDVDMIQFTAPTSHGSSGGAVLNMYGEVIGISTAGMDEGQNINLAVGYEFINKFARGFMN